VLTAVLQNLVSLASTNADSLHFRKGNPSHQVPPPPVLPPQLQHCIEPLTAEPPAAPALHADTRFAEQPLHARNPHSRLQIKNTFIDGGMHRSPSLERLLLQGRQAQSCPGSRLPSPRPGSRLPSPRPCAKEIEIVSSQASTADTTELIAEDSSSHCNYDGMVMWHGLHVSCGQTGLSSQPLYFPGREALQDQPHLEHTPVPSPRRCHRSPPAQVLQLEQMLAFDSPGVGSPSRGADVSKDRLPQLGSVDLPSIGSLGHHTRRCKPCAFFSRMGCSNGLHCNFCHLCGAGEKKRRRKEKRALISAARNLVPIA
jgi:hypothetical protein